MAMNRWRKAWGMQPDGYYGHHYECLSMSEIVAILDRLLGPRMAMWATWPTKGEFEDWSWGRETTGGAWTKSEAGDAGHYGPGYHWAGCSEPVLVFTRGGGFTDRSVTLRNAWIEPPGKHSRKPVQWQAQCEVA